MNDFAKKRITQSNYRGARKRNVESSSLELDVDIDLINIKPADKLSMKHKVKKEVILFLSKIVSEDVINDILKTDLLSNLYKKIGILNEKNN